MTIKLSLPDGQWAELREGGVGKAPERLRLPLRLAEHALNRVNPRLFVAEPEEEAEPPGPVDEEMQAAFGVSLSKLVDFPDELVEESSADVRVATVWIPTDDQEIASTAYNAALIVCMVERWSFGPVTVEAARELPGDAFDTVVIRIREMAVEAASAKTQEDELVPS